MTRLVACTIVAHNYLPLARVVARTFLEHHPDARFVVSIIDRPLEARNLTGELFEVLPITDLDLGDEGFEHMATAYDVTEFATACKPFVLRQLLKDADCVLYLDPDIRVYAPLTPLVESTVAAGWSLTPHCLEPIRRDGTGPTEADIMAAGVYNLGYIGVTPKAVDFLDWWSERLRRDALIDPSNQLFTDQRWIDLAVPIFFPHIERSPAYNVAYWNIDQRHLWKQGDTPMIGDEPLRFFHYSGYDLKAPYWLSKYHSKPRTFLSREPVLRELCAGYAADLRASGVTGGPVAKYGWTDAFPGYPLDRFIRRRFRGELVASDRGEGPKPPSPFSAGGAERFRKWLCEFPEDDVRRIPRYLSAIWDTREDLRAEYPRVAVGDTYGFLKWVTTSGPSESAVVDLLGVDTPARPPERQGARIEEPQPGGVDLVGYLQAELGVGEAGRLAWAALRGGGVPVSTVSCHGTTSRQDHPFESAGVARFDTMLMAVNADQFGNVRHEFGQAFFEGRYVIGQWFWEVESFPDSMHGAFWMVEEVWTPTHHIQAALAAAAPPHVKVHVMPLPLVAPAVESGLTKADFGLEDRFTFLLSFDFLSVLERKNPMAVIDAFCSAFEPGEGPQLVVKSINGAKRLEELEHVRWSASGRPDIVIIDEYFDAARTGALVSACDCYVSLHRAEGLGLTMSEAMALGKPVIATAYSGNVDFMSDETAILIPWKPIRIGPKAPPYPANAMWADPDVEVAAAAMRKVVGDPIWAAGIGAAAKADLAQRFSPEATGAKMRQRLTEIWSTRHGH